MKEIKEVVDLPSVEAKPLLHPLDVAPARRPYLISWLLRRLASLPVAFLFGVVLWVISDNVVTPFVVPLIVLITAALAAEFYAGQAWGYIPGKRMDTQRDSGALAQVLNSFIEALALVSGLLILIGWVSTHDFTEGVEEVTIGIGAGIAVIQGAEVIAAVLRRPPDWVGVASRGLALAAVALAVVVASVTLIGDQWSPESIRLALIGGAIIIGIQLLLWLIRFIGSRLSTTEHTDETDHTI